MNREEPVLSRGGEVVPVAPAAPLPRRYFGVRFGQSAGYSTVPADSAAKLAADSPQYPPQQSLMQYLDGRRGGLRLTAQAMAEDDGRLMEQANAAMAQADAALARVDEIAKTRR